LTLTLKTGGLSFVTKSLPTLEEAISAINNEENRLRVMDNTNSTKPAYVVVDDRECFNCGEKGHLSYSCPDPKAVEVVVVLVKVVGAVVEAVVEVMTVLVPMWLQLRMLRLSL
jgi:hypothetical protein